MTTAGGASRLSRFLVAASIAWPAVLAGGWWSRAENQSPLLTAVVYVAAGRVCHQRPERSFSTAGAQWPVCARCAGLYAAAPAGAIAALAWWRRSRVPFPGWLAAAALPTGVTMAIEFAGVAPVSSLARAVAALPLGAVTAFCLVAIARPAARHRVH